MAVPSVVLMVPRFLVIKELVMFDTYFGMILPLLVDAAGIFIMKQFFDSIPTSIEEAARARSGFRRFWSVTLPMATPALITLTILSFQGSWNELATSSSLQAESRTAHPHHRCRRARLGSARLRQPVSLKLAAAVLMTIPVAVLFFIFQRRMHVDDGGRGEGLTPKALRPRPVRPGGAVPLSSRSIDAGGHPSGCPARPPPPLACPPRRSAHHHPCPRPHVDRPVRHGDGAHVVVGDHHRVAGIDQHLPPPDEQVDVRRVEAVGRLVERDVEAVPGRGAVQLARRLDPLRLHLRTGWSRCPRAGAADAEQVEVPACCRHVAEEPECLVDAHREHVGDRVVAVVHLERLRVVPRAEADGARHRLGRHEEQLDAGLAVTEAVGATAGREIEGEPAGAEATPLRLGWAAKSRRRRTVAKRPV